MDWTRIERLYVEGELLSNGERQWPSYRHLARRFAVSERTIERHGRAGGWVAKQDEYRRRLDRDWERIKTLYIEGEKLPGCRRWPSPLNISERFGVPYPEVLKRVREDGWEADKRRNKRKWKESRVGKFPSIDPGPDIAAYRLWDEDFDNTPL